MFFEMHAPTWSVSPESPDQVEAADGESRSGAPVPAVDHLQRLRRAEAMAVRQHFAPGHRVLELGGGDGYQARILASFGCEVSSLDIHVRTGTVHFAVKPYDGIHIPAESGSFDRVFTSSVLEHMIDLPASLAEIRRVLQPGGLAIHVVPSTVWRFWTSASFFGHAAKRLLGRVSPPPLRETDAASAVASPSSPRRLAERAAQLLRGPLAPHGEHASAFHELYYFSPRRWADVFRKCGFEIVDARPAGLFYTGHEVFPELPLRVRSSAARVLGSACQIFVTRPLGHPSVFR